MKIRIVRQPTGRLEGLSLHHYHPGNVYDLAPSVAEYLVAEGFALVEMRSAKVDTATDLDRRRKPT